MLETLNNVNAPAQQYEMQNKQYCCDRTISLASAVRIRQIQMYLFGVKCVYPLRGCYSWKSIALAAAAATVAATVGDIQKLKFGISNGILNRDFSDAPSASREKLHVRKPKVD